jgi:hypothetical protein
MALRYVVLATVSHVFRRADGMARRRWFGTSAGNIPEVNGSKETKNPMENSFHWL